MKKILFFFGFLVFIFLFVLVPQSQAKTYELSLEKATRLAIQNNFDIQIALYDLEAAKTYPDEARSVYDTFVSAQISYQKNKADVNSIFSANKTLANQYNIGLSKTLPTGTTMTMDQTNQRLWSDASGLSSNPSYDSALGFTIEQDLGRNFFGIQSRGNVKLSELHAANLHYLSFSKIEQIVAEVQLAYWDVVLKQKIFDSKKEVLLQAQTLFELNQRKIKDRLIEQPELLASEVSYEQKKIDVAIAENHLSVAKNVLKLYLNIPEQDVDLVAGEGFLFSDFPQEAEESLACAFAHRRDYQQALNIVKMKGVQLSMKKNHLWPEINLRASMSRNGLGEHFRQSVENITREDHPSFLVGLSISFPLENRSAKAQMKRSDYEKSQALLSLKLLERQIMIGIMDQVRTCNILRQQAQNQRIIADLELRKYQELQKIFRYGRSDMDTLIRYQTQVSLANEQADWMAFEYQQALIHLKILEGVLLKQYWQEENFKEL